MWVLVVHTYAACPSTDMFQKWEGGFKRRADLNFQSGGAFVGAAGVVANAANAFRTQIAAKYVMHQSRFLQSVKTPAGRFLNRGGLADASFGIFVGTSAQHELNSRTEPLLRKMKRDHRRLSHVWTLV